MHVVKVKMSPFLLHIPGFYKTSPSTIIGHNAEVPWPGYTNYMDYELELGIVVGREARNLTPPQAEEVIFGFTLFNDFSARDVIVTEMPIGLGPTKSKDFASGIGPWITTIDELGGIENFKISELKAIARVNGEVWTVGDTRDMIWSPAELLAYISQCDNLRPGDVIGSGTVGNGCTLELPGRRPEAGRRGGTRRGWPRGPAQHAGPTRTHSLVADARMQSAFARASKAEGRSSDVNAWISG